MKTVFVLKSDPNDARKALSDLKSKFSKMRDTPSGLLSKYNNEKTELMNQRAFKQALYSMGVLSQYAINNLTQHLDKSNEGFISIGDFDARI